MNHILENLEKLVSIEIVRVELTYIYKENVCEIEISKSMNFLFHVVNLMFLFHRFTGKHLTSKLIFDGTREKGRLCATGCFVVNVLRGPMSSSGIWGHIRVKSDSHVRFAIKGNFSTLRLFSYITITLMTSVTPNTAVSLYMQAYFVRPNSSLSNRRFACIALYLDLYKTILYLDPRVIAVSWIIFVKMQTLES